MIAVAETTTPQRAAAIRAKLMGTPPPPKKAEIRYGRAPKRIVYTKHPRWSAMDTEKRCALIRNAWFEGVTSNEVADEIERIIGEKVSRSAILATFYRHSAGLLQGIEFTSQGGGYSRPRIKPPKPRIWIDNTRIGRLMQLLTEDSKDIGAIIKEFCEWQGISFETLISSSRSIIHVRPRQKLVWLLAKFTKLNCVQIGKKIGGRDHTTALHTVKKINALIASNDPSVADLKGWLND
jgi:hypothetical protein